MVPAPLNIYVFTSWCSHVGIEGSWFAEPHSFSKQGRPVDPISERSISNLDQVPSRCAPEGIHDASKSDVTHNSFVVVSYGRVIPGLMTLQKSRNNTKLRNDVGWPENDEWRGLEVTWDRVSLFWENIDSHRIKGLRYSASVSSVLSAPSAYRDQAMMGMRMDPQSHKEVFDKVSLFYGRPARHMPMDGTVIASDGDFCFHVLFDCSGLGREVGRPFFHVLLQFQLFHAEFGTKFDDIVIPFTKVCDSPASITTINLTLLLMIIAILAVWLHLRTLWMIVWLGCAMAGLVAIMQFSGFGEIRFTAHFVPGALVLRGATEVLRSETGMIQVHPVLGLISFAVFVAWFLQEGIFGKDAFFTYIHMTIYCMGATLSLSTSAEQLLLCFPLLSRRVATATTRHIRQVFEPTCFLAIGLLFILHQHSPELVLIYWHAAWGCFLINQAGVGLLCSLAHEALFAKSAVCVFMRRLCAFAWLLTGGTASMMAVVMHSTPKGRSIKHWIDSRRRPPSAAEEVSLYIAITIFVCSIHLALLLIGLPSQTELQHCDQPRTSLDQVEQCDMIGRKDAPVYMPVGIVDDDERGVV